jgi:putative spermidine/putrescine transport system ATP-binding protein
VALARALVISPKLLLLDEPLSNLDAKLRIEMRAQIKKMQQKYKITTILITHDQEECFSISDKVAIMNNGKIEQYDTPENIYSSPNSIFVADFVGFKNLLDVTKVDKGLYRLSNGMKLEAEDVENAKKIAIRPQNIVVDQDHKALISGTIKVRTYLGENYQYEVDTELGEIVVNTSGNIALNSGDTIKMHFPKNQIIVLAD